VAANEATPSGPGRREFIRIGITGVAAGMLGCRSDPANSVAPTPAGPGPRRSPTAGSGEATPLNVQDPTWQEPWVWRPEAWPDAPLELNFVATQNPSAPVSPGTDTAPLFSYNGANPAPTIRVRTGGEVRIRLRNTLGLNEHLVPVGAAPHGLEVTPQLRRRICGALEGVELRNGRVMSETFCNPHFTPEEAAEVLGLDVIPSWAVKGHINGQHGAHVTNLHVHGLHVEPGTNPDGSPSDDVMLRILPIADWEVRQGSGDPDLMTLGPHEHVGEVEYRFRLAVDRDGEALAHPPGTHWYHPHPHGATHDQVGSGMAGFLVVEGDVDDRINSAMTGRADPDPTTPTGEYDYRERLFFLGHVYWSPQDLDAGPRNNGRRFPARFAARGQTPIFHVRPGAVERWRLLNSSADGSGTIRFMVVEGHYEQGSDGLVRVETPAGPSDAGRRSIPMDPRELEERKQDLYQLSMDGLTLVDVVDGRAQHTIRNLSLRNPGTDHPLHPLAEAGETPLETALRGFESCFRDGESLRRAFVRPNELFLTNANRADVFFRVPIDAEGRIYTVLALEADIHKDNLQRDLQLRIHDPDALNRRRPIQTVVAHIGVRGDPVTGGDFDVMSLVASLPPVPPLLQPVAESELRIPDEEAAAGAGADIGAARTRVIAYTGTGGAEFPALPVPREYAAAHPELRGRTWAENNGVPVLLAPHNGTMAIQPDFDLATNPEPDLPRKFMAGDPEAPHVLLDTAEEWVVYNASLTQWAMADRDRRTEPGAFVSHQISYPLSRAEGQRRNAEDPGFQITSRANDHPFHMHINPMWVMRIDVPDEHGELHNVLPEPTWMDTVWLPRNGGRAVFRTRFEDFDGTWVNHCHVLLHEDLGMMQQVTCVDRAERADYRPRRAVADPLARGSEIDAIYPKPSRDLMYRQTMSFIDPNEVGFQRFPDFPLEVPRLE
jgi:FtsP/CotA-like multicopper oxidase with cupredoxin domain